MKLFKLTLILLSVLIPFISTQSCKKDPCEGIHHCLNGGNCVDGKCINCNDGYTGQDCGTIDLSFGIQNLIDIDITPEQLIKSGVTLEELYGKIYNGGYIFYLNETGTSGKVTALEDAPTDLFWYDAESYCSGFEGFDKYDWYLPSKEELNLIYINLVSSKSSLGDELKNPANFTESFYWSSTKAGEEHSWSQDFLDGMQDVENRNTSNLDVRPIREF